MANYSLPEDVINKTLEYLGSKPYVETAGLIVAIQQNAKKIDSDEPEPVSTESVESV